MRISKLQLLVLLLASSDNQVKHASAQTGEQHQRALHCESQELEAEDNSFLCSIYVHSSIYDEFASRLAEKVEAFKVGNPFDSETTHGPLIHSKAVDKTDAHVKDAVEKGAKVLVGGKKLTDLGENFYAPTVLTDVQHCAINEDETFGKLSPFCLHACFNLQRGLLTDFSLCTKRSRRCAVSI